MTAPIRWLTVAEVAKLLRVSKMTVYRLVDTDELAHVRVGRSIRISKDGVDRFLAAGGNDPASVVGWKNLVQRGTGKTGY